MNCSVTRGEFKRSVYSDSRRRPLSCTPPTAPLSTSASVEVEDEDLVVVDVRTHHRDVSGVGNVVLSKTVLSIIFSDHPKPEVLVDEGMH